MIFSYVVVYLMYGSGIRISLANSLSVRNLSGGCPQPLAKGNIHDILILHVDAATYWRDLFILVVDYVSYYL